MLAWLRLEGLVLSRLEPQCRGHAVRKGYLRCVTRASAAVRAGTVAGAHNLQAQVTREVRSAVFLQRKHAVGCASRLNGVHGHGNITIRDLDEDVRIRLRMRAAGHGRSVEEETATDLARRRRGEPEQDKLGRLHMRVLRALRRRGSRIVATRTNARAAVLRLRRGWSWWTPHQSLPT